MKKGPLVFVVLLILTLTYPLTVNYALQAYESWRIAELESYPAEMRPYVDFSPFIQSFWGGLALIFGVVIVFSWLLLGMWRKTLFKEATL